MTSSEDEVVTPPSPLDSPVITTLRQKRAYPSSSDETDGARRGTARATRARLITACSSSSDESTSRERRGKRRGERRAVRRRGEVSDGEKTHQRTPSLVFDHPFVHHARTSSYAVYQQSVDIARNTISELDLPASSWCGFFACCMLAVTLGEVVKDEVFHVRQTQHYCAGRWSVWDPKITTLPGLYLLSASIAHTASYIFDKPSTHWCSLEKLRFVNIVMSVVIFLVLYTLFRKLSRRLKDDPGLGIQPIHRTCCMMNSLVLSCFPLLYFYNLLYYTDVGSVLFVMASYSCSIRGHHIKSAMLGVISVLFRQTNIIWVGFTAGTVVISDIENRGLFQYCDDFISQVKIAVRVILQNLWHYIKLLMPYLIVLAGFVVFLVINKGIVVGDKNAHTAVLHFPQFLYFILFLTAFSLPHMVQRLRYSHLTVLYYVFKPVHVLLFFVSAVLALYFFRYEHPYLLADNRHYTFYIWRKILNRTDTTMYMFLPLCFYTFMNMVAQLSTVHSKFFTLLYFVCCAAQMVPQGLLEFRYYLIPYLFYRLHVPQHSWVVLFLELCQYTLINLVTVKVFLNKTFDWDVTDELTANPQRFMW